MTLNAPNLPRPAELLSDLLDSGYTQAARQVIGAITSATEDGIIARRLREFDARAAELAAAGLAVDTDDPVLRALLADFADELARQALLIDAAAPDLQEIGINAAGQFVRQTALPGFGDEDVLARFGVRWNVPDPEAVNAAVQFTAGAAWEDELARFGNIAQQVREIALRGIVSGQGPISIARDVRDAVEGFPTFQANNLMRTLQLQSYRVGNAVHQAANSDILEYQIRIAALDERCCLACVALHGEIMPLGAVVQDHHQGRCTSIAKVKGIPRMVETGEDWFAAQDEEMQLKIAGPAALEAMRNGAVVMRDFVQPYQDPVFGEMIRKGSLTRALSLPTNRVQTINGEMLPDKGSPGATLTSMNSFLNTSEGPLATTMRGDMALVDLDFLTDKWMVNKGNVSKAARAFVVESQNIQYGKDYILTLVQQQAAENGVIVDLAGAERLYNQHYATQARAIWESAKLGNVNLTSAQWRRLENSMAGNYLNMVYSTETSEAGSLANEVANRRRSRGVMTDAERTSRREEFLDRMGRLNLTP